MFNLACFYNTIRNEFNKNLNNSVVKANAQQKQQANKLAAVHILLSTALEIIDA